jgi:predicted transcriptional regulator
MTNSRNYDPHEIKLAEFAKALANPARVAIMIRLAQANTCVKGEIIQGIPLTDYMVSQHLFALEKAGLIKGSTAINRCYYCINWEVFGQFADLFKHAFNNPRQNPEVKQCSRPVRKMAMGQRRNP